MAGPTDIYRGEIVAVDGNRCTLKIPRLSKNPYKLVPIVQPIGAPDAAPGVTSIAVGEGSLTLRPLQAGDKVAVALIEGSRDFPIVLGRL